jgi:hypothetical protein
MSDNIKINLNNNNNNTNNVPTNGNERPITPILDYFKKKNNLGSKCPTIIKHDFPDESKNYLNDLLQEISSTKKRFRYDRPMTAKFQALKSASALNYQGGITKKA